MVAEIPGSAAAAQTYALFNPLDLYQDEVYQKLIGRVPYMSSLSWLKSLEGRMSKRKVRRHEYSYYEEGQFMNAKATILSVTPNGAKFDIVLSPGDHSDLGGTGKTSFPVKNMSVVFQDGKTTGFVESVNTTSDSAHVVTVKKWNPSQDIGAVALAGTTMVFFSNAQPEKSGKTTPRVPQFEKVTNYMQVMRESFDDSDFDMQNYTWFEADGKRYLWYKGINDTMQRVEFQKEAACLLTPQASGLTDASNNSISSMNGLLPVIDQSGTTLEYFNQPDGASFDEVMLSLDNNFGDKKYIVGCGHNLMLALKNFLVAFGQNGTGNLSFSPFQGGSEQAIKLDFKSYSVGAYEFYFQQWDIFSHKDSLGAAGLPYRHYGVFMPAGMTRNTDPDRREGDKEYEPYIQLVSPHWGRAAGTNIDKGEYLMWETGALAAGGPTDDIANAVVHVLMYLSFEIRCRHKFLKWAKF